MEVRYRNDLYGNYMLIEIPPDKDSNQYSFKMLEENKISGVLACKERMEDGKSYWYADISKKKNLLWEYQDRELQLEDMIAIFQQITTILEDLRNYLLSENMVVLDPEYMYMDPEDEKLYLTVLPWISAEKTVHKLAEFLLEKINHRDENGVNATYLFYRQQSQGYFSWYQFLPVLEKESILKRQKVKEQEDKCKESSPGYELYMRGEKKSNEVLLEESDFGEWKQDKDQNSKNKRTRAILSTIVLLLALLLLAVSIAGFIDSMLQMSCMALSALLFIIFLILRFRNTNKDEDVEDEKKTKIVPIQEIDAGMKETVFFDSYEKEVYLKLQWKEKGRKKQYILNEFPCTIGKMKEEVSVVISDISVSRIHCRFIEKDDKVCIMDLNSTNGTYLNGLQVKQGEILEIEKNDEILVGKVAIVVV